MVWWPWLLGTFWLGGITGIIVMALLGAARERETERWLKDNTGQWRRKR